MISFAHPQALFLILALPLFMLLKSRGGRGASLTFSSTGVARAVAGSQKTSPGRLAGILKMAALSLLVVALARPQLVLGETEISASGVDIMLAVDASGSMEAHDFEKDGHPASRLTVVKDVVEQFINERPNDRIGIVAFARKPYLVSPLTLDHDWLIKRLADVSTGTLEDGTAVGSAIASAVNRLKDGDAKSRLVILLTDGRNNAGRASPETAAEAAAALGVKVYTIGAGSEGEAPFPVTDDLGNRRFVPVRVDMDEASLKQVADITGAKYFRATDSKSLASIYEAISRMEKTEHKIRHFENRSELFSWPAGLGLLVLGLWLYGDRIRKIRVP